MNNTKKKTSGKKIHFSAKFINPSPALLQFYIKSNLGMNQTQLAKKFHVSNAAISGAINQDPLLKLLRGKLIAFVNKKLSKLK